MLLIINILIIGIVFLFYFLNRNKRVCDFSLKILEKDYKTYDKLPSYEKMVWSFKPLKLKYWIKD